MKKEIVHYDIIYVYLNASFNSNSVQSKITSQIKAMNEVGMSVCGLFFTSEKGPEISTCNNNIKYVYVETSVKGWFKSIRENSKMLKYVLSYIKKSDFDFNFIYIRSFRPCFLWYKFLIYFSGKVIVEHQTIEKWELKNLGKYHSFGLKPSILLSWMEFSLIPTIQERMWGALAVGKSKILIGVTEEITRYELKRSILGKPAGYTITNGIVVDDFQIHNPPTFDGSELNLLMLIGGSTEVDWHGIDLLIEGIDNYKGSCKINLHIAGKSHITEQYSSNYIIKHGYLDKSSVDALANTCHLALGTFAFERKGITEASTLKMREYAARGMSVVYGHYDMDYEILVNQNLALRLESMSPPDFNKIINFLGCVTNINTPKTIRNIAKKKMDMNVKMKLLKQNILVKTND